MDSKTCYKIMQIDGRINWHLNSTIHVLAITGNYMIIQSSTNNSIPGVLLHYRNDVGNIIIQTPDNELFKHWQDLPIDFVCCCSVNDIVQTFVAWQGKLRVTTSDKTTNDIYSRGILFQGRFIENIINNVTGSVDSRFFIYHPLCFRQR